jgi:hypothetical protein
MNEFMGQMGFVWWFGVVEDTDDPLKIGRVRVRIFGYHTEDKKAIATVDLPWAHPLQGINSASISGIGMSPTGLLTGSHVFGFFRDGMNAQQPVVMFSVGGIPTEKANYRKGFNDPAGLYPTETDKPDTNRLATGDETDKTIIKKRNDGRKKNIPVAHDPTEESSWSEPESPYKPEYPNNKVFATESGMVEEWDDTPKHERHHTFHPSGSFEEVANGWTTDPDGTRVQKIMGNNYELIAGSDFVHINGSTNITINGNARVYIGAGNDNGNLILQVDRDVDLQVRGNMKTVVEKDVTLEVHGNYTETIKGTKKISADGNVIIHSGKSFVSKSKKDTIIKTETGSDIFLSGDAPAIKLNSLARSNAQDAGD